MGRMVSIADAMAAAARELGVEIRMGAEVASILVEGGVARGVRPGSGEEVPADVVGQVPLAVPVRVRQQRDRTGCSVTAGPAAPSRRTGAS